MHTDNYINRAGNCENPQKLYDPDGVPFLARCRSCKKCGKDYVTGWVGKCVLESMVSSRTVALTLTYSDTFYRHSQIVPKSDAQNLIKRLRADGHKVRYFLVSEFGSKKGRGHWHCLLFFSYENPQKPLDLPPVDMEKQHWKYWSTDRRSGSPEPLGFVFVQEPDQHGVAYVLKYIQKSTSEASFRRPMRSLRPPLGQLGLKAVAQNQVDAGLPFSHVYTLDGVTYKNGNPIRFAAKGSSLRAFWLYYRSAYVKRHGYGRAAPIAEKTLKPLEALIIPPYLRELRLDTVRNRSFNPFQRGVDKMLLMSGVDRHGFLRLSDTRDWYSFQILTDGKVSKVSLCRVERVAEIIEFLRGKSAAIKLGRFAAPPF